MREKFTKRNIFIGLTVITAISLCFYTNSLISVSNSLKPITIVIPEDLPMSPLKRKLINKLLKFAKIKSFF